MCKIEDDREPGTRAGARFVKSLAASQRCGSRLRIKARSVVVDLGEEVGSTNRVGARIARRMDFDARARPFAGIVEQVADEIGQVLLFAAKPQALGRVDRKGQVAIAID